MPPATLHIESLILSHHSNTLTNLNGNLSNEQYINGLREADGEVLASIYAEFQKPVVRAVSALGGSGAAGNVFFQTALIEAARQTRQVELPAEMPFFSYLKTLAQAHFSDWMAERGQPVPDIATDPEAPEISFPLPSSEVLRETRQKITAWRKGEQTDAEDYLLWQKMRDIERKTTGAAEDAPKSNFARNLLIFFVLLTMGYMAYVWFARSKTPAEVYHDNFVPPESLMADLSLRYGPARGNDSVTARPSACEFLLREADEFYKVKDYESAQEVLFEILSDSLVVCQSDALFYIGVIALAQENPELALECFAKIEDLEHFGEDIYWYQALAFVKLAEKNPLLRDKAARAVERTYSHTQDSLRREQAEKMLKHLAD